TPPFTEHGAESGLFAFTAAVLGGIGRPRGAFLSGLLLGVLAAFSDFFISSQWTPVMVLLFLIVLLTLRPTGLNAEDRDEDQLAAGGAVGEHRIGGRGRGAPPPPRAAPGFPPPPLAPRLALPPLAVHILPVFLLSPGF